MLFYRWVIALSYCVVVTMEAFQLAVACIDGSCEVY